MGKGNLPSELCTKDLGKVSDFLACFNKTLLSFSQEINSGSVAFLLPFFPGFVVLCTLMDLKHGKGLRRPFQKPSKETWMTLCIVSFLLGFKK